jgi:rod shape-determining protein MreD
MRQTSTLRAALLVALAALLEAILAPYLTFGYVAPRFTVLAIVIAASGLRDLQAVLMGFFGGVLIDALGAGHFGMGALGGVVVGMIATRADISRGKRVSRMALAQLAAVAVAAYDLVNWAAVRLDGLDTPPLGTFLVSGVLPDVLLNTVLALLIGGWVLGKIQVREVR